LPGDEYATKMRRQTRLAYTNAEQWYDHLDCFATHLCIYLLMRIAYTMINCNRRDGSARAVNEVAERMALRGHDVYLYARNADDLDLDLITWYQVPGYSRPEIVDYLSYFLTVNRLLQNHDFDIVHSIGVNTSQANVYTIQNIQPAKAAILSKIKSSDHVSFPRKITRWLYLQATSAAEQKLYTAQSSKRLPYFLPVSRGVELDLRTFYEIGDAPVRIVPNAADLEVFCPLASNARSAWRRAHGIPEDVPLAIFAGGEWARKGLHLAIQGIALMEDHTLCLFVAGDDADAARFKQMARDFGISERVSFGGFLNDVATAMASSDLFLFPSYYEAFSLACIEAAACGIPIVSSKINGTEDFILPGENGEFVEHDPANIAKVLDRLLANQETLLKMGKAARRSVENSYTWDRVADMTESVYNSIYHQSSGMSD
jgi:glycosyltransferase involved in cell wall biosynthesis